MMRACALLSGLVAVVALAACAGAGPGGGECRSGLLSHAASLDEVVDSAALQAEVARIFVEPRGLVLASVRWDSAGAADSVRVLSEWMPRAAAGGIADFMRERITEPGPPSTTEWVLVTDGSSTAVRRLRSVATCPPVVQDHGLLQARVGTATKPLGVERLRRVYLDAHVDVEGRVTEVQIAESSGRADVDLAAAHQLRATEFSPARIEGIRVPIRIRMPVTVRPRSP